MIEKWIRKTKLIGKLRAQPDELSQNAVLAIQTLIQEKRGLEEQLNAAREIMNSLEESFRTMIERYGPKDNEKTHH